MLRLGFAAVGEAMSETAWRKMVEQWRRPDEVALRRYVVRFGLAGLGAMVAGGAVWAAVEWALLLPDVRVGLAALAALGAAALVFVAMHRWMGL